MDKTEQLSALRAELVKLTIHQATIFSNWVKFAITVQGGLAAGLGFVLSNVNTYRVLGFVIAIFGLVTALLLIAILRRHAKWNVWYLRRCNSLSANCTKLFPDKKGEVATLPPGRVCMWVVSFLSLVAIAWIAIFVVVAVL